MMRDWAAQFAAADAHADRYAEASQLAGDDQRLLNRIMKYGVHKMYRSKPEDKECFICEYSEQSVIHKVEAK